MLQSTQQQQQLISSGTATNNTSFIPDTNFDVKTSGLFTSSQLVNDTDMSSMANMNIDHLLELEFSTDSVSVHNQQLIDKYIDLDDIDLNPLNPYQTNFHQPHHQQSQTFTANNTVQQVHPIDEFSNFQFSVCSSSSSGFSEPSFSSGSQTSANSVYSLAAASNGHHAFSSESESSPPTNANQRSFQYDTNSNGLISSPGYHLFQKTNRNNDANNIANSFVIGEFTTNPNSAMISNLTNSNTNNMVIGNSSTDNMFSSFSFLSDEINLKI